MKIIKKLRELGFIITIEDEKIHYQSNTTITDPVLVKTFLAELKEKREEVIKFLEREKHMRNYLLEKSKWLCYPHDVSKKQAVLALEQKFDGVWNSVLDGTVQMEVWKSIVDQWVAGMSRVAVERKGNWEIKFSI